MAAVLSASQIKLEEKIPVKTIDTAGKERLASKLNELGLDLRLISSANIKA